MTQPTHEAWEFRQDAEPCGSSDGFWYDLTDGGYIKPAKLLRHPQQVQRVQEAIAVLRSFERALQDAELLNEF